MTPAQMMAAIVAELETQAALCADARRYLEAF
jgi:hypothetical protein